MHTNILLWIRINVHANFGRWQHTFCCCSAVFMEKVECKHLFAFSFNHVNHWTLTYFMSQCEHFKILKYFWPFFIIMKEMVDRPLCKTQGAFSDVLLFHVFLILKTSEVIRLLSSTWWFYAGGFWYQENSYYQGNTINLLIRVRVVKLSKKVCCLFWKVK